MDPRLEDVLTNFSRIYLGGIPPIITNDSAFLAFICIVTATEALCGYRYGEEYKQGRMGPYFKKFVSDYFPELYSEYADDLWAFRNKLVHAFSTGRFALTHHNSQSHLKPYPPAAMSNESMQGCGFAVTTAPQYASVTGDLVSLDPPGAILNAEDLYAALLHAAQRYFNELRKSAELQAILRERIQSERGGAIIIREIKL